MSVDGSKHEFLIDTGDARSVLKSRIILPTTSKIVNAIGVAGKIISLKETEPVTITLDPITDKHSQIQPLWCYQSGLDKTIDDMLECVPNELWTTEANGTGKMSYSNYPN